MGCSRIAINWHARVNRRSRRATNVARSETFSVHRLLKAHDLITSPAFVVIKAADAFKDKTTAPNQLWQSDFTYLKVIGWGWFYLSTILDDYARYIIACKLCTSMRSDDVTETLKLALEAPGCDSATGQRDVKPKLDFVRSVMEMIVAELARQLAG
jgi:transposase InsO family protein